MLTAIRLSQVPVFDHDEALDFYVGKLGLQVGRDYDLGFMRWLTVRVPREPGREILLSLVERPSNRTLDESSAALVGFDTDDCRRTFAELGAKGVQFTEEPTEQIYGIDSALNDPFGNHIRILEPLSDEEVERRMREQAPTMGLIGDSSC